MNSMPSMIMRATQKNRMSKPVISSEVGIERAQVGGIVGPAERRERPETGAEPGVENVGILRESRQPQCAQQPAPRAPR